jgi:hypothetical protein
MTIKLSKYFTLEEMCHSNTATAKGIKNEPNQQEIDNLSMLCNELLDELREMTGPITVTSGFRCKELNRLVSGEPTSQHVKGLAADCTFTDMSCLAAAKCLAKSTLTWDQLIIEDFNPVMKSAKWLHISLTASGNRKDILLMERVNGRPRYTRLSVDQLNKL